MPPDMLNILGKDYLVIEEAAHYACCSVSQFRQKKADHGIGSIAWMGKQVYRRTDIQRAIEHEAAWQQNGGGAIAGTSTMQPTANRSAALSAELRKARPRKYAGV